MFLFYVHWWFDCVYVCLRMSDPLGQELQTVVSCRVGAGNWTQVLWKSSQWAILTTELSLQPPSPKLFFMTGFFFSSVILWRKKRHRGGRQIRGMSLENRGRRERPKAGAPLVCHRATGGSLVERLFLMWPCNKAHASNSLEATDEQR